MTTIQVVGWNCSEYVAACFESLTLRQPRGQSEIIYVDAASDDDSAALIARRWPSVKVVTADVNLGYQRGHNVGRTLARGDIVILLNPDAVVTEGLFDTLADVLDAHPECAAVSARALYPDGRTQWTLGRDPTPPRVWRRIRAFHGPLRRLLGPPSPYEHASASQEQDYPYGGCFAVRATAFDNVGGLDERYFLAGGDVMLGRRLRRAGWTIRYAHDAVVTHQESRSRNQVPWRSEWDWTCAHFRLALDAGPTLAVLTAAALVVHLLLLPYTLTRRRQGNRDTRP